MSRERSIIEREANAENEFAQQNRRALEALRLRKEELDEEIAALEQRKIDKEKEIETFVEDLRKSKIEALDQEIARFDKERRDAAQKEADQIIETVKGVIATQKSTIAEELATLKSRAEKLDKQNNDQLKKEAELETRELNLQFGEEELSSEKQDIPNQIQIGVERKAGQIQTELNQARKDKEHYKKRLEECERELGIAGL